MGSFNLCMNYNKNIKLLYGAIFLLFFITSLIDIALPLYFREINFAMLKSGIIFATFHLVFSLSSYFTGVISDKIGKKSFIALAFGLNSLTGFLYLVANSFFHFLILHGIRGFSNTLERSGLAFISDQIKSTERGKISGYYYGFRELGSAMAIILSGVLISLIGFRAIFISIGILALLTMGLILGQLKERRNNIINSGPISFTQNLKILTIANIFLWSGMYLIFPVYLPNYLIETYGISVYAYTWIVAAGVITFAFPHFIWGKKGDLVGKSRYLKFIYFAGLSLLPVVFLKKSIMGFILLYFLFNFFAGIARPSFAAAVADSAGYNSSGRDIGIYYFFSGLGAVSGLIIGPLANELVYGSPFILASLCFIIAAYIINTWSRF